jgi:hypothetical protein
MNTYFKYIIIFDVKLRTLKSDLFMSDYRDYTYHSKNVLKRFSHQKRFKRAIDLISVNDGIRLLDFGCGDGFFLNQLKKSWGGKNSLLGFEPILDPIDDNNVLIVNSW